MSASRHFSCHKNIGAMRDGWQLGVRQRAAGRTVLERITRAYGRGIARRQLHAVDFLINR